MSACPASGQTRQIRMMDKPDCQVRTHARGRTLRALLHSMMTHNQPRSSSQGAHGSMPPERSPEFAYVSRPRSSQRPSAVRGSHVSCDSRSCCDPTPYILTQKLSLVLKRITLSDSRSHASHHLLQGDPEDSGFGYEPVTDSIKAVLHSTWDVHVQFF